MMFQAFYLTSRELLGPGLRPSDLVSWVLLASSVAGLWALGRPLEVSLRRHESVDRWDEAEDGPSNADGLTPADWDARQW